MNEQKVINKLIIHMLEEYQDVLFNDGCNDWKIPSKFNKEESNVIHTLMYDFDEREGDFEIFSNIGIVSMLISKLKEQKC